jgi:hypothetical protein
LNITQKTAQFVRPRLLHALKTKSFNKPLEGEVEPDETITAVRNHTRGLANGNMLYRVNSKHGALFRRWATNVLIRFAKNGYVVDVLRLKDPEAYDRVKELREIEKDIRAAEANVCRSDTRYLDE